MQPDHTEPEFTFAPDDEGAKPPDPSRTERGVEAQWTRQSRVTQTWRLTSDEAHGGDPYNSTGRNSIVRRR